MRIIYIGKFFDPYVGGIETVTEELCHGIAERGHDVSCFVHHEQKFKKEKKRHKNFNVIKKKQIGSLISTPLSYWSAAEINKLNPDIVHIHLPNPFPLFIFKKIKAKKVATYHAPIVNKGFVGACYSQLYKKQMSVFDKVITTSQSLTEVNQFRSFNLSLSCLEVIPLSVKKNNIFIQPKKELKKIVFTGRFVKYKGLKYLIESVKNLDVELTLIGDGPLKKQLIKNINKLNISNKVNILPPLSKNDLFIELQKHDLFVLPSISQAEAFGMSALEAMSIGIPVITTDLKTGVKEVNKNTITGLVVPKKNSKALAKGIVQMLNDEKLYKKMSLQAKKRAETRYSLERFIGDHELLYKSLLLHVN